MQMIVPQEIQELSSHHQLGEFVRCHYGRTLISITRKLMNAIFFVMMLIVTLVVMGMDTFHENGHLYTNPFLYFLFSFVCYFLLMGSAQILLAYWQSGGGQGVYEFSRGFIMTKRRKVLLWDDIAALTYTFAGNASPGFQISTLSNVKYMLYCDTVIPRIEQEIIRRNLPDALARYEAGEMLNFGLTHIDKVGITTDSYRNRDGNNHPIKSISWGKLHSGLKEQDFVISLTKKADGKPFRFSLYGIANACILRALLISILSPAMSPLDQRYGVTPLQDNAGVRSELA